MTRAKSPPKLYFVMMALATEGTKRRKVTKVKNDLDLGFMEEWKCMCNLIWSWPKGVGETVEKASPV